MSRPLLLIGTLGAGLVLLIVNHDSGRTFGIANEDFGSLLTLGVVATMIGSGVVASRARFGENLRNLGIWLLVALTLVAVYLYRNDLESFGQRMTAGLLPGSAATITDSQGQQEVVLYKTRSGHFEATVTINGTPVPMLVDTGASMVALSYEDAERLGLDPANLSFDVPILTANGQAMAAPVTLSDVAIGPIARSGVRATIAAPGRLDQSLLGMTFLSTLDFLQMQSDELRIRD